ncbi:MAG: hypothetical protein WCS69_07875 [Ignavibacteriaceae bacterium]|jgi:hypothetical protein
MKKLASYLSIFLLFSFIGCYTIIEKNTSPKGYYLPYKNHAIVGFWIYRVPWIDGRDQIKKIEFFEDGKVTYYPNSEIINSRYMSGNFSIKDDTLKIRLFNNSAPEKFIYEVDGSTLYLNKTKNNLPIRYKIQGSGEVTWEKVFF